MEEKQIMPLHAKVSAYFVIRTITVTVYVHQGKTSLGKMVVGRMSLCFARKVATANTTIMARYFQKTAYVESIPKETNTVL